MPEDSWEPCSRPCSHPACLAPRRCKAAKSTQLLTVSGAPLRGLWLCLIEDQGLWKKSSKV